jgi:isoquinoline 1-oxidoreductase beta subunit
MVHAVIAQCPFLRGTLVRFNAAKAMSVPEVLDVFQISSEQTGGELAIVAKTT